MVIEWLKFRISPGLREKYIQKDEEIWTTFLAQYPGFLSKEAWIDPKESNQIAFVIRWASREEWKAIPQQALADAEKRFDQEMGEGAYELIEAGEYQVRKFPQTRS